MAALGAGTGLDPLADLLFENVGAVGGFAGLGVDAGEDVLEDGFFVGEELPGGAVELPEDAGFADGEQELLGAAVEEDAFKDLVEVEGFTGDVLEVPAELAGGGVEGDGGVGEEAFVARFGAAADAEPGFGLGDAPVGGVEFGVVAAGDPGVAAGAEEIGEGAPGIAAGGAFAGDGIELPGELAGFGVKGAEEAAFGLIGGAAGEALDDLAVDDEGAGGVGVAAAGGADVGLPEEFAGAAVEGLDGVAGTGWFAPQSFMTQTQASWREATLD
ncbi:MAG: hypothetical protein NTX13_04110 [Acidobacteria bacterium]|nr:hypothetical protein [Acidobacteriota bacterium]